MLSFWLLELERALKVYLVGWLKHGPKGGPSMNESEVPDMPWFNVEKGIQRKIEMLQWKGSRRHIFYWC